MDVLTIFFYITNLDFHEIKGIPLQIRVRSLDMLDVLTIDRESLGKIQHHTTKTPHLWSFVASHWAKASKSPMKWIFSFHLTWEGRMSKTNPNKLEQHLLFLIDQASNIARSNDQIQSQSLLNYCNHFFSCPGPGASSKEGFSFAFTILSEDAGGYISLCGLLGPVGRFFGHLCHCSCLWSQTCTGAKELKSVHMNASPILPMLMYSG